MTDPCPHKSGVTFRGCVFCRIDDLEALVADWRVRAVEAMTLRESDTLKDNERLREAFRVHKETCASWGDHGGGVSPCPICDLPALAKPSEEKMP